MRQVLIAHADGEEEFAEMLAVPLRTAGYHVVHGGTVLVGESVVEESSKVLDTGGPVVLCGTARTAGTRLAHRIVNAAQQNPNIRVFVVQMEPQAYLAPLALDGAIAKYWEDPVKAINELISSLKKHYPPTEDSSREKNSEKPEHSYPTASARTSSKQHEITITATTIIILACLLVLGVLAALRLFLALQFLVLVVAVGATLLNLYVNRRYWGLSWQRLRFAVRGASRWDTFFDLLRVVGLAGIVIIPYTLHREMLFSVGWGSVFLASLIAVAVHPVYWLLKKPGVWDREYKLRKQMSATAINYGSMIVSLEDRTHPDLNETPDTSKEIDNAIDHIELNALIAIKSYLEYSVMDGERDNFNVNLIVEDPSHVERLVCIRRANAGKAVPKFYDKSKMPTAVRSMTSGKPIYKPNFVSTLSAPKDYKMIWHVPIMAAYDEGKCVGLLAIDSTKPRHLNLVDKRESLLFNLMPYIALIRYSISIRNKYNIWY